MSSGILQATLILRPCCLRLQLRRIDDVLSGHPACIASIIKASSRASLNDVRRA